MSLFNGLELLTVLLIVGGLFLLGLRLKPQTSNIFFLVIVTLLILGLIYLSKVTMAMFGFILLLIALVIALIILLLRGLNKAPATCITETVFVVHFCGTLVTRLDEDSGRSWRSDFLGLTGFRSPSHGHHSIIPFQSGEL